jgi:HemY protein
MSECNWKAAIETLDQGEKRKHIDKDVARRRRAVLMAAEANRVMENGQSKLATELAVKAASAAPEFSPAVALSAKLLKLDGDHRKAISLIEKAWAKDPHPALALALNDLIEGESERTRGKRIDSLVKTNASHKETHMLQAEEKLRQDDFVGALSILAPYLQLDADAEPPTARLCQLAGQIEEKLGNRADARLWFERAATAPLDPDWSDLDPEGEAFDYSNSDWRRLTFSFGDTGELIHPRYESGASRRRAGLADDESPVEEEEDVVRDFEDIEEDLADKAEELSDIKEAPAINSDAVRKEDLSARLDSLLDKPKS